MDSMHPSGLPNVVFQWRRGKKGRCADTTPDMTRPRLRADDKVIATKWASEQRRALASMHRLHRSLNLRVVGRYREMHAAAFSEQR